MSFLRGLFGYLTAALAIAAIGWYLWPRLQQLGEPAGERGLRESASQTHGVKTELSPEDVPAAWGGESDEWLEEGYRFHVPLGGWAAASYGDQPSYRKLDTRAADAMRSVGRRGLRYDPALARAAQVLAEIEADGEVPVTGGLADSALTRAGVVPPQVRRFLFFTSARDDTRFLEHLAKVIERHPAFRAELRVGVGRARGARDPRFRYTYLIATWEPRVTLDPVPRVVEPGERIEISGRLLGGLGSPKLLSLEPGGEVQNHTVSTSGRSRFRGQLVAPEASGELWVELLAEADAGPEVAALFPVWVGAEPPERYDGIVPPEEGSIGSPGELEGLAFDLLNSDRARLGLPALHWDEGLAEVARGHAVDMRDNGFVAHVSPTWGTLSDRADRAGYPSVALGENVARDTSVYSAEEALMRSLGHRANILGRRYTHVGIGVAIEETLNGERALSIVQNFALPALRLDPSQAAAELRRRMDAARVERDLEPLRPHGAMDAIAARALRTLDSPSGVASRSHAALGKDRPRVGSISIRVLVLPSLAEFEVPESALGPRARWLGLATAQGENLADDPRLWVVLFVAE